MRNVYYAGLWLILLIATVFGAGNYAVEFDGIDDNIRIPPDASLNLEEGITVEFWMNCDDTTKTNLLINKPRQGGQHIGSLYDWAVILNTGGRLRFRFGNDLNWVSYADSLDKDTWYHIACRANGDSAWMFVDGAKFDSTDNNSLPTDSTGAPVFIGKRSDNDAASFFDGTLDEIRLYNRALTDAEILAHYNDGDPICGNEVSTDSIHAFWALNNFDHADTVYDQSSFDNDGALKEGASFVEGIGYCSPVDPMVTVWNSEFIGTPEHGYVNPDTALYLTDYTPEFSAIITTDSAHVYNIQVEVDTTDGHVRWDSDWTAFDSTFMWGERCQHIEYDGSVLRSGYVYRWKIAFADTINFDTTEFTDWQYFKGSSAEWFDERYPTRQEYWLGRDHDTYSDGKIIRVPLKSGEGKRIAENVLTLGGDPGEILFYDYFMYTCYQAYDTNNVSAIYVLKYDYLADTFSAPHTVETDMDTLMGKVLGEGHYSPSMHIDKKSHYLHLFRNGHDNQAAYYRTTDSCDEAGVGTGIDITSWRAVEYPEAFARATYLKPNSTSNGDVFVSFRHKGDDTDGDPTNYRAYYCIAKLAYTGLGDTLFDSWSDRKYVAYYHDWHVGTPSVYNSGSFIDENDRYHLFPKFNDAYGDGTREAAGRGIAYIFSDFETAGADSGWYRDWKIIDSTSVGVARDSVHSDSSVHFDTLYALRANGALVDTCDDVNGDTLGFSGFISGNSNSMAITPDGNPVDVWVEYWDTDSDTTGQSTESDVYLGRWYEGAWDIYNISEITGYQAWNTRTMGGITMQGSTLFWYYYIKPDPDSVGYYYSGELLKVKITGLDSQPEIGVSATLLSSNSGTGIGRVSVPNVYPDSLTVPLLLNRSLYLDLMWDETYLRYARTGEDITVVFTTSTGIHRVLDRIFPEAVGQESTWVYHTFPSFVISSDLESPGTAVAYGNLYIYSGYIPDTVKSNPDSVYTGDGYFTGFEEQPFDSTINALDDWVGNEMTIDRTDAFLNTVWNGNQFIEFVASASNSVCTLSVGADLSNVDLTVHFRPKGGFTYGGFIYIELLDTTDEEYVRARFDIDTAEVIMYKNSDDADYDSSDVNAPYNKFYIVEFLVHGGDGVTCIIDYKDTLFVDDDIITVFDKFIIKGNSLGGGATFDVLTIEELVENRAEIHFAPVQSIVTGGKKKKMISGGIW